MDIVVGTAGHIDHGKTALVKALTGVDADRLPDEKRRGITIDLGFAEMTAGDVHFGFVDVPGHERFVRNMLAGASGIDLVLLIVAADEGVMPQTREHFEICRLLGLENGVVVLTKSDLVDEETLDLASLDVAELVADSFLEKAPVIAVSSKAGDGIDELKEVLVGAARDVRSRGDRFVTFLPVDRSFSIKGFGTVVTGTLNSGEITDGDELLLLPDETRVRVRGVQSHGQTQARVGPGRRTAVNLAGIDHDEVTRGMVLTRRDALHPTQLLDCEIELLASSPRPLKSRQRVRVHVGTAEVLARVQVLNDASAIEPGGHDRGGQGAQDAHQDVGLEDRPARVDTGQLGRIGITAVCVDVATEFAPRGDPRHHDRHADEQDDRERESCRDLPAARWRGPPVLFDRNPIGQALWPEVVVREPGDADDGGAAGDPEHDLGPHRTHREPVASALASGVDKDRDDRDGPDQGDHPRQQPADGALCPAADQQEGLVESVDGGAV